jgi:hypothetical protein
MPKASGLFVNKVLSALTENDLDLLTPHLQTVDLPLRKRLEIPRRLIEHLYFPLVVSCPSWPMARPTSMWRSG